MHQVTGKDLVLIQFGPHRLDTFFGHLQGQFLEKSLLFGQQIVHAQPLNLRIWGSPADLYKRRNADRHDAAAGIHCIGGRRPVAAG